LVDAVKALPPPLTAVYQPPKVYPVLTGGVGRLATVVAGEVTVLVVGLAPVVAPWLSKVTV
jgi:hypothetical protein